MKTRKNRKIYNFTKKQRRRDRNISMRGRQNAPWSYVHPYNATFRAKCKTITWNNVVYDNDQAYPLSGRHTANWDYW